ncbi:unnamed protein product [Prunus armeniaca]|uniref:Uncharacterized protein n=1 Tax=Prunus armeniaca TaxID=36596 RepID=A0A6J5TGP7_PRUAR|nr:unnamed protein product [Prunus armeniaca]
MEESGGTRRRGRAKGEGRGGKGREREEGKGEGRVGDEMGGEEDHHTQRGATAGAKFLRLFLERIP